MASIYRRTRSYPLPADAVVTQRKRKATAAELRRDPAAIPPELHQTSWCADRAIDFIRRNKSQPFYVNLWPDDVHSPFWPPVEKWGNGTKRDLYLGVLEAMDQQFGKLFDYVRGNDKLRGNTLILICSDNGCEKGAGRAGPRAAGPP